MLRLLPMLLLLAACTPTEPPASVSAPAVGVTVTKVALRQVEQRVEYIGRTVAVNDVALQPQVEGYMLQKHFEDGQDVEANATLFTIDPGRYEALVASAKASVAQAEAELARVTKDLERYQTLIRENSVSQQELDRAQSDKLSAEANLQIAQAQLQQAQIDLEDTLIKAPFSGRLGKAEVALGALVTPQTTALVRLVELDPIYAMFNVSEADVLRYRQRERGKEEPPVEVRLKLPDDTIFSEAGEVDFVDNVVDGNTGTVRVRARFANPDKLLVPGLFVSTVLSRAETEEQPVIPQKSVQEDQAGRFVLVVLPDETVERRSVQLGALREGAYVVRAGLEPDEQVIVDGIQKVRPGMRVTTQPAQTLWNEG